MILPIRHFCSVLLIATGLLWAFAACAQPPSAPIVQWYVQDFPPISILSGVDKGKGWADLRIKHISESLPSFHHVRIEATALRLREDQLRKDNVCSANMLRTPEREGYVLFSDTALWVLPNGLVTTRRLLPKIQPFINTAGELSLEALLASQHVRVSITPQRSFGRGIDDVLQRYAATPAIISFASSNHTQSRLLKLANQESIDAFIAFDVELRFLTRTLDLHENDFVFLPLVEAPALVPTYVGCSKSVIGAQVIQRVNALLADPAVLETDRAHYQRWLSDDSALRYRRLLAGKDKH